GRGVPAPRGAGLPARAAADARRGGRAAGALDAGRARPFGGVRGHRAPGLARGPAPAGARGEHTTRGSAAVVSGDLFGEGEEAPPPESALAEAGPNSPLADRMRPRSFEELVGQEHLLEEGSPIAL